MASAAETSETLLSKLESADSAGNHRLISDYLNPFADLHNKKKEKTSADLQTLKRSLAKTFTPFLNLALAIHPKRLADPSNLDADFSPKLFDIYRLCLYSMDAVSSQFSGKPYKFHIQRIRLVCTFEKWGRHWDAESEALAIQLGKEPVDLDRRFVPGVEQGGADKEFGALIGEVVYILARCASAIRSKEEEVYERLLCMDEELAP